MRRFALLFVLLLFSLSSLAQLPTASLNGTVSDPAGAVVADAKVTLTNPATGATREGATASDGGYVFSNLAAGAYTLTVEAQGFAKHEAKNLVLQVGRVDTLNISLKVAAAGEVVTVTASETSVELAQSHVAGQIGAGTVEDIPLNGRNFLELAFLIPGNRPATNYDPTKTNTLEVSSAGAFGRGGNLTVDGGDNNDEVVGGTLANFPQDGVQEFQIATNRFTAEVGRSGSSIINIITKSGTNEWHGSAFVFFRDDSFQGLPATFDRTQPTPPFDRQQFGGSLGGPLKKDRAFVFGAVENRNQDYAFEVVERDLANYAACTVVPTPSGCLINTAAPGFLDDLLITSRADFKPSDRDNIFARYSFNKNSELASASLRRPIGTAAQGQISDNRFHSFVADWTRTIASNKVNNLLFHLDTFLNQIPEFAGATPATFPAGLAPGNEIRFPSFQDGASFRIEQRTRMNRYQIKDNFSWTVGKHNIRFGGEWQNAGTDVQFDLLGSGTIFTAQDFATADTNADTFIDDRDIQVVLTLTGVSALDPPEAPFYRNNYFGLYFQDDWKVLPNLTLNLGLRWDFDADVLAEGDLSRACPAATPATTEAGCLWLRRALGPHDTPNYKNFGPRFGFAWDPFRNGTTVVRGGYGIYYDRVVLEVPVLEVLLDGRVVRLALTGGLLTGQNNITLAAPFAGPAVPGVGIGVNIIDTKARQPLVQQFTFGLQHQFGRNWIVSADAVHNFGQRLLIGRFLRQGTSLDPAISLTCNGVDPCTVTDPGTGIPDAITNIESSAKSWYSGLLANLQKRPTGSGNWKWGFNIAYTLSKSFNYANDDQIPFNGAEDQVNLAFGVNNPRLEKGYSPTDERHRFVFYGIFDMPWKISFSPIWTIASSVPIDSFVPAINARLPLLQRNALGRDIKTGAELNTVITAWNALPACNNALPPAMRPFPCNAGGALGLVDPNLEFGDSFNSLDFRLTKTFTFAERHNLQLIGEAFNIFNVTNIRGFNNNNFSGFLNDITSASFNRRIRTAGGFFGSGGPRAFQFAVRYSF